MFHILICSLLENLDMSRSDVHLVEGDIAVDEESRGSVGQRLWPGGVFVYDIESSLGKIPELRNATELSSHKQADSHMDWHK